MGWRFRPAAPATAGGPGGPGAGARRFGGGATAVTIEPAKQGELRNFLTALGTVTAANTATIRSRADGQLLKVHFEEGQRVKAGDLLAEIDPRSYQVALQQAEGQLARDRALLANARLDLQRYESAHEAVTQQQIDASKTSVAQYEGTVKADEGSVASYQLQLSYCRVTAPIDGRVGLRLVDVGNLVRASDATGLLVITQDAPIMVIFNLPEDSLPGVRRAMRGETPLEVEIFDRSMKRRLATGTLIAIDNQIDTTTGTVRLKATIPNEDLALFPNQFVNVRLLVNTVKDATLIPTSAIQIAGTDRFAYVVDAEGVVQRRAIKTGNSEGLLTAVTEGVAPGEQVATEGLDRLQNGAHVTARAPVAIDTSVPDRPRRNRNGGAGAGGPGGGAFSGERPAGARKANPAGTTDGAARKAGPTAPADSSGKAP